MMIPKNQDDYLAEGYFRAGHTLRQTRYVFVEREMYTTIWSRVPLHTARFSRSQRKLLNRVERRYTITAGRYEKRDDQDELYARYRAHHPLEVAGSIDEVLGVEISHIPFQTLCVRVEDGDELVALSCFDVGNASAASLFGCYAPERRAESLGFATLLIEIDYCTHLGDVDYYYPGYCVPGLAPFAYKFRLPDLEGKTFIDEGWHDMREVLARPLTHDFIAGKLDALAADLDANGIRSRPIVMPLAEHYYTSFAATGPLPHVQMLALEAAVPLGELFIGYDAAAETYEMWLAAPQADLRGDPVAEPYLDDFAEDADLRVFSWRIPVFATQDPGSLMKYLQPGKTLARIVNM